MGNTRKNGTGPNTLTLAEIMSNQFTGPEGLAKLNNLAKVYKKEALERDQIEEEIMSNDNYLNWLEGFTRTRLEFQSDSYYLEYSPSDQVGVNQLGYLYRGVNKYARGNGVYPVLDKNGSFYSLEHNGVGFEIGTRVCNGITSYYCKRTNRVLENFISSADILSSRQQEKPKVLTKLS